jgi:SAM-dependent methyltransferase
MDARIAREAAFHNDEYNEPLRRKAVGKPYLCIQASIDFYRKFLQSHAPGKDVLEYGCGVNSYAYLLSQWGARAVGIDISEVAIQRCREANIPGARFETMNCESLDFPDDSFDLVCGIAILHHLNLASAVSEIARVLRPGGVAIFREPLGHNPAINLFRKLTPNSRTPDEHPLCFGDLNFFRQHFRKVELTCFYLFPLLALPFLSLPGRRGLLKALSALDRFIFERVSLIRKYAWGTTIILSEPVTTVKTARAAV